MAPGHNFAANVLADYVIYPQQGFTRNGTGTRIRLYDYFRPPLLIMKWIYGRDIFDTIPWWSMIFSTAIRQDRGKAFDPDSVL